MRIILLDATFNHQEVPKFNLQITENGLYTIVGEDKNARITLLKGIAGLLPCTSGVVLVGNFRPDFNLNQNLVSFWDQANFLYPEMTGFDHLKLLAKSRKQPLQTVFDTSNDLKMINYIERPVKTYPRGILTRFKLALSAIDDKPLILLNEPMTDIDEDSRIISQTFIKKIVAKRTIVVTAKDKNDIINSTKIITLP